MSHSPLESDFCPYRGLDPYNEEYRDYFFGRERDEQSIVSNMYAKPLTVLYGASGVGKTSVLMAGVIPHLRETLKFPIVLFRNWQGENFLQTLKESVAEELSGVAGAGALASVEHDKPFDIFLSQCVEAVHSPVFLVLDQFEEYFLYHPASDSETSFDAQFSRAVNRRDVEAKFLLSMREEGLSKLDRFRARIPNMLGNTLRLNHLNSAAAKRAVCEPLRVYNERVPPEYRVGVEPKLLAAVLRRARQGTDEEGGRLPVHKERGKRPVETPVLQILLTRVWEAETRLWKQKGASQENGRGDEPPRVLRYQTLQTELGGAEHVLKSYLDEPMESLNERERETASKVFQFLVTGEGAKIASTPATLAQWSRVNVAEVQSLLEKLSDPKQQGTRILRSVPLPGQSDRYEIFHDVLGRAVLNWAERYRVRRELEEGQKQAAAEAEEKAREEGLMLQIANLHAIAAAERQRAEESERRIEAERRESEERQQRVEAERLRAEERQRHAEEQAAAKEREAEQARALVSEKSRSSRRLRTAAAALAVLLVLSAAMSVYAFNNYRLAETRAAEARAAARLESEAKAEATRQSELAIQNGIAADEARKKAEQAAADADKAREAESKARKGAEASERAAKTREQAARVREAAAVKREEAARDRESEAILAKTQADTAKTQAENERDAAKKEAEEANKQRDISVRITKQAQDSEAAAKVAAKASEDRANEQARSFSEELEKLRGNLKEPGDALYAEGLRLEAGNQLSEALGRYSRAIQSYGDAGNRLGQATVGTRLGDLYLKTMDYARALEAYDYVLKLYVFGGDVRGMANAFRKLGNVYLEQSRRRAGAPELQQARASFANALTSYAKVEGDEGKAGQAATLDAIGDTFLADEKYDEAILSYKQAEKIYDDLDNAAGESRMDFKTAFAYQSKGDKLSGDDRKAAFKNAVEYYERSLEHRPAAEVAARIETLDHLAELQRALGNSDEADRYARQAQVLRELQRQSQP